MPGAHNFLVFDENKDNMLDDTSYENSLYRQSGVTAGVAPSNIHNKLYYQATLMMTSLAQALANKGYVINDTDPDGLTLALQGFFLPVGTPLFLPRLTPPPGFLVADGSALSRTTYSALWEEAQSSGNLVPESQWTAGRYGSYSSGNGTTTFRIPDLRAEFVRGLDLGRGVDKGRVIGSWQNGSVESHRHDLFLPKGGSGGGENIQNGPPSGDVLGFSTELTGGAETRPRNVALLPCIKY